MRSFRRRVCQTVNTWPSWHWYCNWHDVLNFIYIVHDDMLECFTEELKKAVVAMMVRKDEVEEQNK